MRIAVVAMLVLASACAPTTGSQPGNGSATGAGVAQRDPSIRVAVGMRGAEPATSQSAIDAKAVVERYCRLIGQRKYKEARLLWGNGGADSGGDAATFAATFAPYSIYRLSAGEPTEIRFDGKRQYIAVAATLHARRRENGAEGDRAGSVLLRRSAEANAKDPEQREWRIWGVDIRKQH